MAHHNLDLLDKKILRLIAEDARIPFLEVARSCNVSGAAIHQRIQKLTNLGIRQRASSNKSFQRAVLQLAAQLRKDPGLSSSVQLDELAHAEKLRREMHPQFYMTAGT